MNSRWFWLPVLGCNAYLISTTAAWYRYGWLWALAVAVGGPVLMVVAAFLTLTALFFFGSHSPLCIEGCGRRATLQIRRKRYLRALCEPCSRRLAGLPPLPSQLFEESLGKPEEWRL